MKAMIFAKRNAREMLRDPLNLAFGLGFPIVLILLLSAIQANIPVSLFEISALAPGVTVFGLTFMTLFSALLISKDRGSSLLQRLYTTPMSPLDFILGYTLPVIPISMAQTAVCYTVAFCLGLAPSFNILISIIFTIPTALTFIGLGLLFGSILTDKQVGGICGALLTNLAAWLSGIWFDIELIGGAFKAIAYHLPFVHSVEMQRAVIAGNFAAAFGHLAWVASYSVAIFFAAVLLFLRQMKKQ